MFVHFTITLGYLTIDGNIVLIDMGIFFNSNLIHVSNILNKIGNCSEIILFTFRQTVVCDNISLNHLVIGNCFANQWIGTWAICISCVWLT